MRMRRIGKDGFEVTEIGLGCMGMSEFYGPADETDSLATLRRARDLGVTLLDTADTYGLGHNETLVGRALRDFPGARVATKFGIVREAGKYERRIDNSPAYIRSACDASLRRLGIDVIDLYYAHRLNHDYALEDTIGTMGDLVKAGKVRAIGLCEVSAETLRKAHTIHPIAALQSEYSLWTRDPEPSVLPACRELGVTFVAYSPLGRGFLTGAVTKSTELAENDFRRLSPRFQGENLDANLKLIEIVNHLAAEKRCTAGQLALAWLLHKGDDIVPIPGTKRIRYLEENVAAADVRLSAEDLARIDAVLPPGVAHGERYPAAGQTGLNA